MHKKLGILILFSVLLLSGCGGGGSSENIGSTGDTRNSLSNTINEYPRVNLGKDIVTKTNKMISITGVAEDNDGTIVQYLWKKGETVLGKSETLKYSSASPETVSITLTVKDDKGATATDTITITTKDALHVSLLLHGMNSSPATWNTFVYNQFGSNRCPEINDGVIPRSDKENAYIKQTVCYRTKFGAYDTSGRKGLENIEAHTSNKGDFSTFEQLGTEVQDSVRAIINKYPEYFVEIAMIAHSRGGIAARTFLQNSNEEIVEEKNAVVGLLTLGTPHKGTPLARFYKYMKKTCSNEDMSRDGCTDNWEVIDFLRGQKAWLWFKYLKPEQQFDLRTPTIADMADDSDSIEKLNYNSDKLPKNILYSYLSYSNIRLGELAKSHSYTVFNEAGYNIGDQVSYMLKNFILQNKSSSSVEHVGDGVVPNMNQMFPDNVEVTYKRTSYNVHHTDETKEQNDIHKILLKMFPNWIWS